MCTRQEMDQENEKMGSLEQVLRFLGCLFGLIFSVISGVGVWVYGYYEMYHQDPSPAMFAILTFLPLFVGVAVMLLSAGAGRGCRHRRS